MANIEQALQAIKEESLQILKDELKEAYEGSREEVQEFIEASKEKAKAWGIAIIAGELTLDELKVLLLSEKEWLESKLIKIAGIQQVKSTSIKDKLLSIILDKLGTL